ncbi:hypothetical protein JMJ35_007767 [Cladonia borealis]|uniref:Uncharacterized protein n=1 Tax=Cladonia borealis TaxID=184061 RepID=A0AA39QUE6_9LECA|nr:hypothetical protein JMJ35_007767 [Cladonia borealis]
MSLPFGLTPLPTRPASFQFHPRSPSPTFSINRSPSPTFSSTFHHPSSTINRSPSPTFSTTTPRSPSPGSIHSIHSLQHILSHRRCPSTTSVIPSARSSMFGEEVEEEDVAVMGVMEPRPRDERERGWVGIGEVLGGW